MKIYNPSDKLNFGKYKGEDLRFVYTFEPSYIEWLLIHSEWFLIDINKFKDINTSPLDRDMIGYFGVVGVNGNQISLREFLTEYTNAMESYENPPSQLNRFTFSEEAMNALAHKMEKYKEKQKLENEMEEYIEEVKEEQREMEAKYSRNENKYDRYGGPMYNGEILDDDFIDDVLDGNPEAYWNID